MNTTQAMALVSVEEIIGMHVELHSARYLWGTAVCRPADARAGTITIRRCASAAHHRDGPPSEQGTDGLA